MRIGEVAQRTGLSISNIRFYEKKGLIGPERNEQNRYREYEEEDVQQLEKIILYRKMDFTIETIAELLDHKVDVQQAMELQIDHLEEQLKIGKTYYLDESTKWSVCASILK